MAQILCLAPRKRPGSAFLCKLGKHKHNVVIRHTPFLVDEEVVEQYPTVFIPVKTEKVEELPQDPAPVSDSEEDEADGDAEDVIVESDEPVADDEAVAPVIEADDAYDLDALQEEAEARNELLDKINKLRGKKALDELAAEYKIALDRTKSVKEMKADFLDALDSE